MKQITCNGNNTLKVLSTKLNGKCKNLRIILLLITVMAAFSSAIYGGKSVIDLVDPSFNPQIQTNSFRQKQVSDIVSLPDSKILVAGNFNSYNRQPVIGLARLNADATLDTTFNTNLFEAGSIPQKIILQTDGKILIHGYNLKINGQIFPLRHLIRLNSDGTIDSTFNYNEGDFNPDIAIDASGRIYLSGTFLESNGYRGLIRLNADGSKDTTFQVVLNRGIHRVTVQNNKVIVYFTESQNGSLQRLNEDGTIDNSFTPRLISDSQLIVQPDSKILILSAFTMQRINENGGDDPSFVVINFSGIAREMELSGDGRITASLVHNGTGITEIRRFLSNGVEDNSFIPYNIQNRNYSTFGLQSDGSVLIGDFLNDGTGTTIENFFLRLLPNGSVDHSFNIGGIGFQIMNPGKLRAITVQPDGKILIGGSFDSVNDSVCFKIARLNENSTLDPTFQINTSGVGNYFSQIQSVFHIVLQNDGKMIVSGSFNYFVNGEAKINLVRLNSDGSIDTTFNLAININDTFGCCNSGTNKTKVLSDNKLMVGTSRSPNANYSIPIKFNSNGTVDNSFNPTIYTAQQAVFINDLVIQQDGKIIIGGRHSTTGTGFPPDSIRKSFIARLNTDGSTDETFQISEETDKEIFSLALLPDDKILVVKGNLIGNPIQQSNVLRLNSDGSIDNTFDAGTSADGKINVILALPTGNIFVGGRFTSFNGQARQNLAQLNADGSLDPTIYAINDEVLSLAVDSEGRIIVGGSFTVISAGGQSVNRSYIARLISSSQSNARTRFDFDGDGRADLGVFNNSTGSWSILNSRTDQVISTRFGLSGDKLAPADYDGDGKEDIAVYRPAEGIWYLLRSRDGFGAVHWGLAEDKPVAADYDGDGLADIAVWRPSTGVWYILQSSNGQISAFQFGLSGDIPLTGADFDGDGLADIAVWRPSEGNFYWLASGSGNQFKVVRFGQFGDIPAIGDYNGDGKTDLVLFRPNEGNWYQYLTAPNGEYTFSVTRFGSEDDEPIAADYDGDGKTDIAVRRQNVWHILKSTQGYAASVFADPLETAIASSQNQ